MLYSDPHYCRVVRQAFFSCKFKVNNLTVSTMSLHNYGLYYKYAFSKFIKVPHNFYTPRRHLGGKNDLARTIAVNTHFLF